LAKQSSKVTALKKKVDFRRKDILLLIGVLVVIGAIIIFRAKAALPQHIVWYDKSVGHEDGGSPFTEVVPTTTENDINNNGEIWQTNQNEVLAWGGPTGAQPVPDGAYEACVWVLYDYQKSGGKVATMTFSVEGAGNTYALVTNVPVANSVTYSAYCTSPFMVGKNDRVTDMHVNVFAMQGTIHIAQTELDGVDGLVPYNLKAIRPANQLVRRNGVLIQLK
jgi:hypothetical protein